MPGFGRAVTLKKIIRKYLMRREHLSKNLKKLGEGVSQLMAAITKHHRLGGLHNRYLFSQCWKLEI